ncbi:class 3 adenylate cyclase [Paenibacillus sp. BK033]|uniref:adenylate/guanylate cyclase domain-containing protein n=1 Tax=Paenibacillus sp. BK033 TaxID=2512133 RepID=UPI00104970D6|nr:adenylate/guanylate cyclase domain-containing protein [Paenibacillus sp. BK033]TCM92711.1 class 3 adenylate cyclase [Paenibacillus sp. BK033]
MALDILEVKRIASENYKRALDSLNKSMVFHEATAAISDVVPGYKAKSMEFGDYIRDNFTVLFIDMRGSTNRAVNVGPEATFLTMHAYFPAVSYVVEHYGGYTMDFTGDGLMAFFGGNNSGMARVHAMKKAGSCGRDLLRVISEVVNPILQENGQRWPLKCGVGIDHGNVIVTKIGTDMTFDVKAFGDCVNGAAKLCQKANDCVLVSKKVKDDWPSSDNGRIRFRSFEDGYVLSRSE